MKYCPVCGLRYGEGPVYCDADGAVLLEVPPAGPDDRAPAARAGVPTWLSGVAGLALGAALCAAVFLAYLYFARGGDEPQPTVAPSKTADGAPAVRREQPGPAAVSSEPEETETPEPEPSPTPSPIPPTPAPPPAARPRLAPVESLSTTPATTEGRSSERVVLHLDDGTTVEADAAWAASDAVWYRRGTILQSIDRGRVRGVESKPATESEP